MPPIESKPAEYCARCGTRHSADPATGLCLACLANRLAASGERAPGPTPAVLPAGYELVETLGRGGMGEVYLVYEEKLARYVAVKKLAGAWQHHERARQRFLREAQAAARLAHPGIVPILDVGTTDGALWYSMEYVEGGDLGEWLGQQGGRLAWPKAIELVIGVVEAIDYAHRNGVAHRDLKPSNILLDARGRPKVADFGLAWFANREGKDLTATGEVLGTPAYLPPEALSAASGNADPRRGDIYSIGALLYNLVAGEPPFTGDSPAEILAAIGSRTAPRLDSIVTTPPVPAPLADLCAGCLAKTPEDRIASALALRDALVACASDPPSRWHLSRPARRRAAALALCGGALLAVAGWYAHVVTAPATHAPEESHLLAIAPLEAVGGDADTEMLAQGLRDEIAATLMRMSDLSVIATRSTNKLRADTGDLRPASHLLGADVFLLGRVRRWEDKVWAAVQLVDARDATIRWSRTYIVPETNALNLQTEIATEIAVNLDRRLHRRVAARTDGTASTIPSAQTAYARAHRLAADASNSVAELNQAEALLERAVQADPEYALAFAQLSVVHTLMYHWGNDRTAARLARGLEAAQRALRLNPDLAEAEIALGLYYFRGTRDYASARRHLGRALAAAPNNPAALEALAHVERRQGAFRSAAVHFAAALRLDPLNAILAYNTVDTFICLRDYERASLLLGQALERLPRQVALVKLRGDLYVAWKGDLGPMRDDIEHRDPTLPTRDFYLFDKIEYLILAQRAEDALATLQASELRTLEGQSVYLTRDGYEALLLKRLGRDQAAAEAAQRALRRLQPELERRPNDARLLFHEAQMRALTGDVNDAEQLARRLLTAGNPASVDAYDRGYYLRELAVLFAIAHDDSRAVAALRELLSEPNRASRAYVRLHPALAKYLSEIE